MAEATIPVDLRNPGQVFACLGLMEAAALLFGSEDRPADVLGSYAWQPGSTSARFTVGVAGDLDPVQAVLQFLVSAKICSVAPKASSLNTVKWSVVTEQAATDCFPFVPPDSPATLPARLTAQGPGGRECSLRIEHWGDSAVGGRDNVKFWAGAGGYPGVALARDAIQTLKDVSSSFAIVADPLDCEARMSSSFRFDWRRDYVPLDAGFSPNDHTDYAMVGYPLVELLAAIGLQNARPQRMDKLNYRYAVPAATLPLVMARCVLGGQSVGFPCRTFRMRLGWPGKEGQARCILDAQEEFNP